MMKLKLYIAGTFLFLLLNKPAIADSQTEKISDLLFEYGLENISVESRDNTYLISYENRTFLYEINVLGKLLSDLGSFIPERSILKIYPQSSGKIISEMLIDYQDYLKFKNDVISQEEFAEKISFSLNPAYQPPVRQNSLLLHTDLVLSPSYSISAFDGPTIYFNPQVYSYFDHGFSFSSKFRLPLYNFKNSFDFSKNFQMFPPSLYQTNFNYASPISGLPLFTTVMTGHRYTGYHGVFLTNDTQYMLYGGFINLGINSGLEYLPELGRLNWQLFPYGQLYYGDLDLMFEGGAGFYPDKSYGFYGRLTRQFDFSDLGFSIYRNFGINNSGWRFNFEYRLAIGPEPGIKASAFRLTYPRFYSGYLFAGTFIGETITSYKAEDYIKRLYPEYLKKHLYYWKKY